MFTFKANQKNPLFYIGTKGVYYQFKKDEDLRIPPFRDTSQYLDSDDFRETYLLSRKDSKLMKRAIQSDTVPEGHLSKKFYMILNSRLYNTIDLRGTPHEIHWEYPHNVNAWGTTTLTIGSSGVGKTHLVASWIERSQAQKEKKILLCVARGNAGFNIKKAAKLSSLAKIFYTS